MSTDPTSSAERREATRYLTCYPFELQTGDAGQTSDPEVALVQDLSERGAFVLTVDELAPGSRVKLHLDFGQAQPLAVEGRVLRTARRSPDVADLWHYGSAIELVPLEPETAARVRELARSVAEHDEG